MATGAQANPHAAPAVDPSRPGCARRRPDPRGDRSLVALAERMRSAHYPDGVEPALDAVSLELDPATSSRFWGPPARVSRRSCVRSPASSRTSTAGVFAGQVRWPAGTRDWRAADSPARGHAVPGSGGTRSSSTGSSTKWLGPDLGTPPAEILPRAHAALAPWRCSTLRRVASRPSRRRAPAGVPGVCIRASRHTVLCSTSRLASRYRKARGRSSTWARERCGSRHLRAAPVLAPRAPASASSSSAGRLLLYAPRAEALECSQAPPRICRREPTEVRGDGS